MFYFIKDISFSVLLLVSIALKILPLAGATQKSGSFFQSCRGEFFGRRWRGEKNDMRENASQ